MLGVIGVAEAPSGVAGVAEPAAGVMPGVIADEGVCGVMAADGVASHLHKEDVG